MIALYDDEWVEFVPLDSILFLQLNLSNKKDYVNDRFYLKSLQNDKKTTYCNAY